MLALFFFPLVHGPFQATHGPTTAFRTRRLIFGVIYSIVRATLVALAGILRTSYSLYANHVQGVDSWNPSVEAASTAILRC